MSISFSYLCNQGKYFLEDSSGYVELDLTDAVSFFPAYMVHSLVFYLMFVENWTAMLELTGYQLERKMFVSLCIKAIMLLFNVAHVHVSFYFDVSLKLCCFLSCIVPGGAHRSFHRELLRAC